LHPTCQLQLKGLGMSCSASSAHDLLQVPACCVTSDAICAGVRQLYLEDTGKPGDLRVSEVYEGDPAVKGSIFVHERT
jgi:hypothetical protein